MASSHIDPGRLAEFKKLAAGLPGLDIEAYEKFHRDPAMPILGLGPRSAPLCIFGRDPGREEVKSARPFMGAAGQVLRRGISDYLGGQAGSADTLVFWLNTVPYKPLLNKVWPQAVQRGFQPLIRDLMLNMWDGDQVLTVGTHAYTWFMIGQDRQEVIRMQSFWCSERRYDETITVELGDQSRRRLVTLHPVPHPSPANAAWRSRFPALLAGRLEKIFGREN